MMFLMVIKTFNMISKYYKVDTQYEFALIQIGEKFYLTDQKKTYPALNEVFELSEPDVQKNLNAIIKEHNIRKMQERNVDRQSKTDIVLLNFGTTKNLKQEII